MGTMPPAARGAADGCRWDTGRDALQVDLTADTLLACGGQHQGRAMAS